MAFSRFKHPLRAMRKKTFRTIGLMSVGTKLDNDRNYYALLRSGVIKLPGEIDDVVIDGWKSDYPAEQSSFKPAEGNITFPFYNKRMHDLLINSSFMDLIDKYFMCVYRKKPVLQTIPSMIVTYPNINQEQYDSNKNHFPAGWHIDYPYEFTVHIPFEKITLSTSHTKYIYGSQYRLSSPPLNKELSKKNNTVVDCVAEPGDVLCLDVEGWHRAQLEQNSYRAMIQLKFTAGNDLLHYCDSEKQQTIIKRSINAIKNIDLLKERLRTDLTFIESLKDMGTQLDIINDNKSIYKKYIEI